MLLFSQVPRIYNRAFGLELVGMPGIPILGYQTCLCSIHPIRFRNHRTAVFNFLVK